MVVLPERRRPGAEGTGLGPVRETRPGFVTGEVLDAIYIEIRDSGGRWNVFAVDPKSAIEELPLSYRGRQLGGTFDQAMQDAFAMEKVMGFTFKQPEGLFKDSPSTKLPGLILPPGVDR